MGKPSSQPKLAKEDFELLAEFRYTLRTFLGFSEEAALSHSVSPQQYQALLAIEGFPGRNWVTVGELAEKLRIAHHSAGGLINRMETLDLLQRATSEEDRRRVEVRLTPKGHSILEKLYWAHHEELQLVGPQLIKLLRKATPTVQTSPDDA